MQPARPKQKQQFPSARLPGGQPFLLTLSELLTTDEPSLRLITHLAFIPDFEIAIFAQRYQLPSRLFGSRDSLETRSTCPSFAILQLSLELRETVHFFFWTSIHFKLLEVIKD